MPTLKKVMVVDDDVDDRETFINAMEIIDPVIVCAESENGEQALQMLRTGEAVPDVIFLDLNMPLMDGRAFLTALKKITTLRQIPVAVLTTSSDPMTRQEVFGLGADYFITKPDKFRQWQSSIKEVLAKIS